MNANAQIRAAFEAWKAAEIAAYYAAPCSDEHMEQMVDVAGRAFDALQACPVLTADDMLLKLFPLLIRDMEPPTGKPPMRPTDSRSYSYPPSFYERLVADLAAVAPQIGDAMGHPCRSDYL